MSYCSLITKQRLKNETHREGYVWRYSYCRCQRFLLNLLGWKPWVGLQFWSKHSVILQSQEQIRAGDQLKSFLILSDSVGKTVISSRLEITYSENVYKHIYREKVHSRTFALKEFYEILSKGFWEDLTETKNWLNIRESHIWNAHTIKKSNSTNIFGQDG